MRRHPSSNVFLSPTVERRRHRLLAMLLAFGLVIAQLALTLHTLHHFIADSGEQHHCPVCKLADHSPAVPVVTSVAIAEGSIIAVDVVFVEKFIPPIVRPALPRGPPAVLA